MSSLVERDFVLRLIKQLVELIVRALKLAKEGKADDATQALEAGALTLLGVDFRTLTLVDTASAADLLGSVPRMYVFARLLDGLREVAASSGDELKALVRAQHAKEMTLEVLKRSPNHAEAKALLESLERAGA